MITHAPHHFRLPVCSWWPFVIGVLLLLPTTGAGDDDTRKKIIKGKVREADALMAVAKFKKACDLLEEAWELGGYDYRLLHNLGRCHEKWGDSLGTALSRQREVLIKARENFRKVVSQSEGVDQAMFEDASSRFRRINARINAIEAELRKRKTQPGEPQLSARVGSPGRSLDLTPSEQRATKPPSTRFYRSWWFWTIVSAAVVGASVAIALSVSGGDDRVPGGEQVDWDVFALEGF